MIKIKKSNFTLLVIVFASFIFSMTAGLCFAKTTEQTLMALLPLVYFVSLMFSGAYKSFIGTDKPGFSIVNILYFVKCVVYPAVSILSNSTYVSFKSETHTAILMEYGELLVIYVIYYCFEKFAVKKPLVDYQTSTMGLHGGKIVLILFIALSVVIVALTPTVLSKYSIFMFATGDAGLNEVSENSGPAEVAINLSKIILVILICNLCYAKYQKSHKSIYVVLSILSVCLSASIVSGVSRSSFVIPGICGFILLIRLFPSKKKLIFFIIMGIIVSAFATITIIRFGTNNSLEEISYTLQAYFCGEKNMAIAIETRELYGDQINIRTFFSDICGNWMAVGGLFRDYTNISEYFNLTFYGSNIAVDQIVPTVGQSYIQFGPAGTYLYTIIMTCIIMFFDRGFSSSKKVDFSYIYLYGTVKCAVTLMGNFKIFSATAFNILLPIFILFFLNQALSLKKRGG